MKIMKTWTAISAALAVLTMGALGYVPLGIATAEDKNIEQMITEAKTPAEHEAIAAYYEKEAQVAHQKHEKHLDMRASYEKTPAYLALKTSLPWHCETIAKNYQKTATEYEELAKFHREMAKPAK